MFEQDYLMRMILQLVNAIVRSMGRADGDKDAAGDPALAAKELEGALGDALGMDSSMMLSLAPESVASILSVSGTDPALAEYAGRTLALEADYLRRSGQGALVDVRLRQAEALGASFGFSVDGADGRDAMEAFLAERLGPEAKN